MGFLKRVSLNVSRENVRAGESGRRGRASLPPEWWSRGRLGWSIRERIDSQTGALTSGGSCQKEDRSVVNRRGAIEACGGLLAAMLRRWCRQHGAGGSRLAADGTRPLTWTVARRGSAGDRSISYEAAKGRSGTRRNEAATRGRAASTMGRLRRGGRMSTWTNVCWTSELLDWGVGAVCVLCFCTTQRKQDVV